ncbi:MAG: pilus assembly protein [Phenylobacterium sp.]|uniref:TadE/TadG family type IV pilus assembly protein n=1 Tax=Phenylobacterium sp. TaxID=1871053 RepID=UPI001A37C60B|nr:TadE/TadG family type IV pilus assembly protein [Phenylobacterium sp.]MBL8770245.1 pilus assembly protein [Phenylobacterium sp.]
MSPASAFSRDERGATAIEFAFVAPILFFALLSLIEIGMLGMMSSGLDNAVIDTARRIRTGRDDMASSANDFKSQICTKLGGDSSSCMSRLTISVQKFPKFYDANQVSAAQPAGQFDPGGPGDIVLIKANYRWPLMTPFLATAFDRSGPFEVTIASRAAFKNEPYE